jgi:hypothetical protein
MTMFMMSSIFRILFFSPMVLFLPLLFFLRLRQFLFKVLQGHLGGLLRSSFSKLTYTSNSRVRLPRSPGSQAHPDNFFFLQHEPIKVAQKRLNRAQ